MATFIQAVGGISNIKNLWCDLFHLYDKNEVQIAVIEGTKITEKDLKRFGDFVEFKPELCGYDYTHHRYFKKN